MNGKTEPLNHDDSGRELLVLVFKAVVGTAIVWMSVGGMRSGQVSQGSSQRSKNRQSRVNYINPFHWSRTVSIKHENLWFIHQPPLWLKDHIDSVEQNTYSRKIMRLVTPNGVVDIPTALPYITFIPNPIFT